MCDTLCVRTPAGTLFAKNSDRPSVEVQLPESLDRRPAGRRLRTQYLEIDDEGAASVLLSRPDWLWGAEHGVNEHGVAIGNEKVDTRSGVGDAPPALIGMDLVRLGLERGRTADEAIDVMGALLERYGQGGLGDRTFGQAYDSSFLVADSGSAWVLETCGRSWAAQPVPAGTGAAISNRLSIRTGWTRASCDVAEGTDVDAWRDPTIKTGFADVRLAASRAFLGCDEESDSASRRVDPASMVAHLRDHGTGPWGQPVPQRAATSGAVMPPPTEALPDGTGVTVCMHVGGLMATTASLVSWLPSDEDAPLRTYVSAGSPCVSVYVPMYGTLGPPPDAVGRDFWLQGAALRNRVEADGVQLAAIREVLDPLESALWSEADELADRPDRWPGFVDSAWRRVAAATSALV